MVADTYDYVIVGAGSAGCVLANRLTEDPGVRVCLLEAGGKTNVLTDVPFMMAAALPTKLVNWGFETVPQPGLNGRKGYQPRGKVLGGSSAINGMIYIRGVPGDYDGWRDAGNPGWGWDDVLPYFKKAEHNETLGDDPLHGAGGPLNVTDLRSPTGIAQVFIDAANEMQIRSNADFNGPTQEGAGFYQVTQKDGRRCSAADGYLAPIRETRPNLTVLTKAQALGVLTQAGRATGVKVRVGGALRTLNATREVLVAAGALQSPQVLHLSGIGPAEHLKSVGVPVVHDLSGVGANLHDHPDFVFGYGSRNKDTVGVSVSGTMRIIQDFFRFRKEKRGLLTTNFAEAGAFLNVSGDGGPPDIQLHFVIGALEDHARKLVLGHGFSCHVCLLRPQSRGSVTLASADPMAAPLIDPNFLGEPADMDLLVKGFKATRAILEAPAFNAHRGKDRVTAGIETDDDIRRILRARTDTIYHPVGTCRMGPDPAAGDVVDSRLRVHGIGGLRVVDASIMPQVIGGNTNAPTIMIAEKAADMIKADAAQAMAA